MNVDRSAEAARYLAIERKAYENHVLELVRAYAAEKELQYREHRGRELHIVVREVKMTGEYPETKICIRRYERGRDREHWKQHPFWKDPSFRKTDGEIRPPERVAGDILIIARGG